MARKFTEDGLDYLTSSLGNTVEDESQRKLVWTQSTFEHNDFPNAKHPELQLWTLEKLYQIRFVDVQEFRDGKRARPSIQTAWNRTQDESGKQFFLICKKSLNIWNKVQKRLEQKRTQLNAEDRGNLVPTMDSREVKEIRRWLLSADCHEELEEGEESTKVNTWLREIFDKLDEGIDEEKKAETRAQEVKQTIDQVHIQR